MTINPYYNPEKLDLEMFTFNQPNMGYEFNTLCFWATENGRIYTASDSGCSCPVPFEDYEGENQIEIIQKLEQIDSIEQAESVFDSWNKDYDGGPLLPISKRQQLSEWIEIKLKGDIQKHDDSRPQFIHPLSCVNLTVFFLLNINVG